MKRVIAAAVTLLCVACGGSGDETAVDPAKAAPGAKSAAKANVAPEISKAEIEPANPGASTSIDVAVVAKDQDRDAVRVEVEWYRNGSLVEDLTDTNLPGGTFARGDRIYAIVYASDGEHEVSHQTPTVVIGNSAPTIRRVAISPPRPTALDLLQAEPEVVDADGDAVELQYRWLRNGQPIAGAEGPRVPPGAGHRGEQIVVQVQATDGNDRSGWVGSTPIVLSNAPPGITTQPNYTLSGAGQYSYEIGAKDPDGDRPLKYELVEGPPGMSVDVASGQVTWRVPADAKGTYGIELAVSDPYGGRTTQKYALAVDWGDAPARPASPAAKAKPTTPPAAPSADAGTNRDGDDAAERDEDYTDEDQGEEPVDEEF